MLGILSQNGTVKLPYTIILSWKFFYAGLQKVVVNLVGTFNLTSFIFLIGVISIWNVCVILVKSARDVEHPPIVPYIVNAAVLFSVGWLFLFASSQWVEMNQFAWRYFIFVLFSFIFVFALRLASFLNFLSSKNSTILTALAVFGRNPLVCYTFA